MVADRLEVRLDPEHRRKLAELAQAHGATVSTLVREWIDQAYQGVDRARRVRAAERIAELQVEEMPDPDTLSRQLDGRYESSVMARVGADWIVSADRDFDTVPQVERLDPANVDAWRERVAT